MEDEENGSICPICTQTERRKTMIVLQLLLYCLLFTAMVKIAVIGGAVNGLYTPEKEAKYPTSFKVDFVGQPYEGACYYRITRCPICIYAEKLGVSELMPLFCELDEVMITLQHGVLHRKQTLANGGEYCDYFITGNRE